VINETVEANEIDPVLWYPEGRMPELVREWPITRDLTVPNVFARPEGGQDRCFPSSSRSFTT